MLPLLLLLALPAAPLRAGSREIGLGIENFFYRTAQTALNRGNLLGLDREADLLRGALDWKESHGDLRLVFRGYVERAFVGRDDGTSWVARQAYGQYGWGTGASLRAGKQRVGWGSGFAWNPTNRVDPAKNPLNPSLEQEGAWGARMDFIPARGAGVVLVGARSETGLRDFPLSSPARERRTAAVRARFLVADTDLAAVFSGGRGQPTLLGFDVGRNLGGLALHAEGALQRGSELEPRRTDATVFRIVAGLLHAKDTTSVAVEYFFNGDGKDDREAGRYLAGLDAAYALATDPSQPAPARAAALQAYLAGALLPYSGGLGLRRHYLYAAWTRGEIRGAWTLAARGVLALSDGGIALTPGFTWAPRGDLTLAVDAVLLLGPADSEFRLAPLRTALQARLKLLF